MLRSLGPCAEPGCAALNVRGERYCDKHLLKNTQAEAQRDAARQRWKNDDVSRMYSRAPWPSFRTTLIGQNPICQRLLKGGVQCQNWATLVHHLLSPRIRPDLFVSPQNCVALCATCHTPEEGTPHWKVGVDYVPTEYRLPNIG
jgi:hypothetical protein